MGCVPADGMHFVVGEVVVGEVMVGEVVVGEVPAAVVPHAEAGGLSRTFVVGEVVVGEVMVGGVMVDDTVTAAVKSWSIIGEVFKTLFTCFLWNRTMCPQCSLHPVPAVRSAQCALHVLLR